MKWFLNTELIKKVTLIITKAQYAKQKTKKNKQKKKSRTFTEAFLLDLDCHLLHSHSEKPGNQEDREQMPGYLIRH